MLLLHRYMTLGKASISLCPRLIIYQVGVNKNIYLVGSQHELIKYVWLRNNLEWCLAHRKYHKSICYYYDACFWKTEFLVLQYKFGIPATTKASTASLGSLGNTPLDSLLARAPCISWSDAGHKNNAHRRSWSTTWLQSQECLIPKNTQRNLV